jgi:hypothetical protein
MLQETVHDLRRRLDGGRGAAAADRDPSRPAGGAVADSPMVAIRALGVAATKNLAGIIKRAAPAVGISPGRGRPGPPGE